MKVVYNMFGFHDYPLKATQNKFRVGSGYVVYDYKSDTDVRVAGRIFSRKGDYRNIIHNTPFLSKQCGHCGFPLVAYTDIPTCFRVFDVCPICGKETKGNESSQ